jgi:RNA polymerase sigma-70 factor, ECF subfamily
MGLAIENIELQQKPSVKDLIDFNTAVLRKFALSLTHDSNEADDLFQDTVYKILKNQDRFEANTNFKAWATTIMRNTFINRYRGKNKVTFSVDSTAIIVDMMDKKKTYNDGESQVQVEFLNKLINSLDAYKANLFKMYSEGYSYKELSEMTKRDVNTLRGIIFSTRQELMGKLKMINY